MQPQRPVVITLAVATLTLFLLTVATQAMARGGPGGGGARGGGPRGGGPRGGPRMGGMQHHRMGPASGGSFSSRARAPSHGRSSLRPPMRSTSPRSTMRSENPPSRPRQPIATPPPEGVQEERTRIREEIAGRRQDARDEDWDRWRYRRYREELGTTYASDYFYDDDCQARVVVDGVTYYECDGVWYRRAYSGGTVNYVVVEGPRSN